jgi:hypothetical protein
MCPITDPTLSVRQTMLRNVEDLARAAVKTDAIPESLLKMLTDGTVTERDRTQAYAEVMAKQTLAYAGLGPDVTNEQRIAGADLLAAVTALVNRESKLYSQAYELEKAHIVPPGFAQGLQQAMAAGEHKAAAFIDDCSTKVPKTPAAGREKFDQFCAAFTDFARPLAQRHL